MAQHNFPRANTQPSNLMAEPEDEDEFNPNTVPTTPPSVRSPRPVDFMQPNKYILSRTEQTRTPPIEQKKATKLRDRSITSHIGGEIKKTSSPPSWSPRDKGSAPSKPVGRSRGKTISSCETNPSEVKIYTFGDGGNGKLGIGSENKVDLPIIIKGFDERISTGVCGSHNCAFVTDTSSLWATGNGLSQHESSIFVGNQTEDAKTPIKLDFNFKRPIKSIALGNYHAVILTKGGYCYTWGWGGLGQLGHGDNQNQPYPKLLQMKCIRSISVGTAYTMVITEFGELYAFGSNAQGQLGIGHMENHQNTPSKVRKLHNVEAVGCGISHSVAICGPRNDSRVFIWGQIKTGIPNPLPTEVESLRGKQVCQVSCGEWHSIVLTQDGQVYFWDLGSEPTLRVELKGHLIKQISAGNFHSAAVDDNGLLYTWGRNSSGQLGRQGETKLAEKVSALDSHVVCKVDCGDYHTMAIIESNSYHLLLWKLLKKERSYYRKISILHNYYAVNLPSIIAECANISSQDKDANTQELTPKIANEFLDDIIEIKDLHSELLALLDESLQQPDIVDGNHVGSIFRSKLSSFHVYLKYADSYNNLAIMFSNFKKENEKFSAFLNEKKKQILDRYTGPNTKSIACFELKQLCFEPLKHVARYVKIFKKLIRMITKYHPDKETLSWAYERFEGLLERVSKNFNLVNPLEVLTSTLNEYGHPEIAGANLKQLVERLTYHQFIDNDFTLAFLLTYRLFTTPEKFLNSLISRYHYTPSKRKNDSMTLEEQENIKVLVQNRVLQVIKSWVRLRVSSYDFDTPNSKLIKDVLLFMEEVKMNPKVSQLALNIEEKLKSKQNEQNDPAEEKSNVSLPKTSTFDMMAEEEEPGNMLDFAIETIAETITLWDWKFFKEILPQEFLKQAWSKPDAQILAPKLLAMTNHFNDIGCWVAYEVLTKSTPKDRAQIIQYLLQVAKKLQTLNNFNGMCAVVSGLNNSSVTRLKKTFQKLDKSQLSLLDELNELVQGADNFRLLRNLWNKSEPPAIPFLAITLKDLTFLDDGNPDRLQGGGINFYKWRKISEQITGILEFQSIPYPTEKLESHASLQSYIQSKAQFAKYQGTTGLYKLSKKCE